MEVKIKGISKLVSQALEGGTGGSQEKTDKLPPASPPELREAIVRKRWHARQSTHTRKYRAELIALYGEEMGKKIKYAEAYELCEYGTRPSLKDLRALFPIEESKLKPKK